MKSMTILFGLLILFGTIGFAYAHTAKIVGDYKLDVGWEHEPPVVGEKNAVEVVLSVASDYDKQRYDKIIANKLGEPEPASAQTVSGLADKFDVEIKLGDKKTSLTMIEDPKFPGVYRSEYTPEVTGDPSIHLFATVNKLEFEATFHPESVEESKSPQQETNSAPTQDSSSIPTWIRNNAGWWAQGQIGDITFVQGIQYLIQKGIIKV